MLKIFRRKLRRICSRLRWLIWRRPRPKLVIKRLGKWKSKGKGSESDNHGGQIGNDFASETPIQIATFNVAMFSLAPAVQKSDRNEAHFFKSPQRSKPKGSINLPENEISLVNSKLLSFTEDRNEGPGSFPATARSPICFPFSMLNWQSTDFSTSNGRSILEVIREINVDILALQDVKAEEEKGMKPLSELASSLGMKYVFAESWAPEYGNAVLSKWPIKTWKIHKIANDHDFRNLLKVTIEVPRIGEINVCCTQLDHLDENWRMKQINAITQSLDCPHILLGGLNSLEISDYSSERWINIVKYYEQIGKPTPKTEVMKYLKARGYTDSKDFAGDYEAVVMIAKGQNVQGTCKYETRVDYILTSPDAPFKFVPGSYSVGSSKGTSDHHIVKAGIVKTRRKNQESGGKDKNKCKRKIFRVTTTCSSNGKWYLQHT